MADRWTSARLSTRCSRPTRHSDTSRHGPRGSVSSLSLPVSSTASPGLLAKTVTTLDVLSGGRAMLGIGAAWNEEEARGLGLFFPPTAERFERLEEALQICLQMWSGNDGPYDGRHYQLDRTLNSPQSLTPPHPPILIGGSGERKTLRLVARYAQACNLFPKARPRAQARRPQTALRGRGSGLRRHREDRPVQFRRGQQRGESRRHSGVAAGTGRAWILGRARERRRCLCDRTARDHRRADRTDGGRALSCGPNGLLERVRPPRRPSRRPLRRSLRRAL